MSCLFKAMACKILINDVPTIQPRGIAVINIFLRIFSFFASIWAGLSNEQKDRIINILVDAFEVIFRKYYRDSKNEVKHGEA